MSESKTMPLDVRIKLSLMMFLQFMLVAVWFVQLAAYLDNISVSGYLKYLTVSTMALGCLASPIIGMIADRHFASQKVLCILNFLTAILLFLSASQTNPTIVFIVLFAAMLCYMPTWGLTNTIAMANSTSEKFAHIRVFGSIGWVAAALFSLVSVKILKIDFDGTSLPLYCGAGIALIAALTSFILPNTPPPAKGQPASVIDALGLKAATMMKDRNFFFFIIISTLVMVPFTLYFSYCANYLQDKGYELITGTMSIGQVSEILFMLIIPLALARMGIKWALLIGLIALVVRYGSFWLGNMHDLPALDITAITVHGLIFGFFFVGGQIYVDKKAPKEIQAQAQGFMFLITFGIGMFAGSIINGKLIDYYTTTQMIEGIEKTICDWNSIWKITTITSAVLTAAFLVLFNDKFDKESVDKAA